MKTLKFKTNINPTGNAHQLCDELEKSLGVKLKKDKEGDVVEGFFNTSSDGLIEIFLYEDEDVVEIEKKQGKGRIKKHSVVNISDKIHSHFISKGIQVSSDDSSLN